MCPELTMSSLPPILCPWAKDRLLNFAEHGLILGCAGSESGPTRPLWLQRRAEHPVGQTGRHSVYDPSMARLQTADLHHIHHFDWPAALADWQPETVLLNMIMLINNMYLTLSLNWGFTPYTKMKSFCSSKGLHVSASPPGHLTDTSTWRVSLG